MNDYDWAARDRYLTSGPPDCGDSEIPGASDADLIWEIERRGYVVFKGKSGGKGRKGGVAMEMRIDVSGIEFGEIRHVPGTGYERKIRLNTGGLNYVEITLVSANVEHVGGYDTVVSMLDDLTDDEIVELERAGHDKIMERHPELWGDTPQQPDSDDANQF